MKTVFSFLFKLLTKVVTLVLLSTLTIFNSIFKVFAAVYSLVSIPLSLGCLAFVAYDVFTVGWGTDATYALTLGVAIVALRFLMPLLVPVLETAADNLKVFFYTPIRVTTTKSPVRYTM